MRRTLLAVCLLAFAGSAGATTINHQGLDFSRGMIIQFKADGVDRSARAGVSQVLVDGLSLIDIFCANLFLGITPGQNYVATTIDALAFDSDGGRAAWLMTTFLPSIDTAVEGAAMQLAIWDLIHDGGDGFNAGRIRTNASTLASVLTQAEEWRALSSGKTTTGRVFVAPAGERPFQEQMFIPDAAVPEPSSLALLGIGALAVVLHRRRV